MKNSHMVSVEVITQRVLLVRGQQVILDRDLAALYGVRPIALRRQVKRNRNRFPEDFMFRVSRREAEALVSQNVIPSRRSLGGFLSYAFTDQGVAMLSSVLRSEQAVRVNIAIMRAFVGLRRLLATHPELARKIEEHDRRIKTIFGILDKLSEPPPESRRPIGFTPAGNEPEK